MKFLFDLFPVLLFFIVYTFGGRHPELAGPVASELLSGLVAGGKVTTAMVPILLATAIAVIASVGQIAYLLVRRKKIDPMLWYSFATIMIFGGATIYLQNETFIKWKPTVLYWGMGGALFFTQIFLGKNLIRAMLEEQISLPDPIWLRLTLAWGVFFIAMGFLNLYIAFHFPLDTWVSFKVFGFTGLMIVFVLAQIFFLSKHLKDAP